MKNTFKPGDLVQMMFGPEHEPGIIVEKSNTSLFRVLISGEIYRSSESMLTHAQDE